jgi:ubiquitin-protein ligase
MTALSSSQVLDDYILFDLDKFQRGTIKKRLVNELVEFKENDAYILVVFEENYIKKNDSSIKITIVPSEEDNIYSFTITRDYPFKPPSKFTINYKDYSQYLKIDSPKTIEELRKYNNIQCLCCNNILCAANWSPGLRMKNFITEFIKMKKYRRDIINRLLAKKIVDKYLNPDLIYILNEWLGLSQILKV